MSTRHKIKLSALMNQQKEEKAEVETFDPVLMEKKIDKAFPNKQEKLNYLNALYIAFNC